MKRLIIFFYLSIYLHALPQGILNLIQKSGIPQKDIGIYIKEVGDNGNIIASLNATSSRTPASVIKVLTTYASVLKLGFNYRWPTKFYITGRLSQGILHGNLYVKGFGDPTLNDRDLKKIVSYIHAEGIRKITGNIVIDRSYFRVGNKDSSGFDNHLYSAYNAMPDAMMFNERVSTVCVIPNKNDVYKKNSDESYKVVNKLQRVNKPCKGRYSWPGVRIDKSKVIPTMILQGKISKRCGKRNICQVITKPYKSFYYALKAGLKSNDITLKGTLRLRKVPQSAKEIFTYYSTSLEKIVSKTAKKSNNLYARHMLLLLGAKLYGAPATVNKGRKAVEQILRNHRALNTGLLKIDNGSGLSRSAKISAKMLADMYDHAYNRYGQRWMNTLSIAGVDGTIKKRFRGTIVKNRAWMKTGTLKRVKNIGGYVKSQSGILYTTVILVQTNKGTWRAAKLQNNIMQWLVKYKGRGRVQKAESKKSNEMLWSMETDRSQNTIFEKYYVQAGAFKSQPSKTYLIQIERLGLPYKVKYSENYKVYIGAYSKEHDARKKKKKVRKHINSGAFIVTL